MTSVAFLVDGDMEKKFLSENCGGNSIRRIGNGDRFPAKVIAKQVMTQVRLLSNRVEEFVLLLDLERREMAPEEFAAEIRGELDEMGLGNQKILIVIKDRTVEDWILADAEWVSSYVGSEVETGHLRGKGDLSRLLRDHNIKYSETTIGCEMLKGVICSRAAGKSNSLNYLRKKFPTECWWLNR